jgi:hypothetical protein
MKLARATADARGEVTAALVAPDGHMPGPSMFPSPAASPSATLLTAPNRPDHSLDARLVGRLGADPGVP